MNRLYFDTRAKWAEGVAFTASKAAHLLRQLRDDLRDESVALIRTVRETDLGRGIVVECTVRSEDYVWPLLVDVDRIVGHAGRVTPHDRGVMFGDPSKGAVRVVWDA